MSTLPVVDTSVAAATGTQYVPHFADGGGWTTQILLVNPTDTALSGSIQFFSPGSGSTPGQSTSTASYSVAARSSQRFVTVGTAAVTASGSVRVVPTGGGAAPVPLAVFTYKPGAVRVSEAGAPANAGTAFRVYVESSGNIQSGIAIANTTSAAASVTLQLFTLDGAAAGSGSLSLPASGQTARFLSDFFPRCRPGFRA
jgi:hypothetical protein